MSKEILFIHGGGNDGHRADRPLAASLQANLGEGYKVNNPKIHTKNSAPDFGWLEEVAKHLAGADDGVVLVGHSFGASMILKYLSENAIEKKIGGVFLVATPYWSGDEEWKSGIRFETEFASKLPPNVPVYFYHCKDDDEVPPSNLNQYRRKLNQAHFMELEHGGHQFDDDLAVVAEDIRRLG